MIAVLQGAVFEKRKNSIVVLTSGGVGYEVTVTQAALASCRAGDEIKLRTYLKVGQDAMDLYGFISEEDRDFFAQLMTVSGIGPKTAMNILALGSIQKIKSAIARGDVKYLTGVSGLGKKTAERLVLELKSKIGLRTSDYGLQTGETIVDVIDALVGMGYGKDDAKSAVEGLESEGKTTEQFLKDALKRIK